MKERAEMIEMRESAKVRGREWNFLVAIYERGQLGKREDETQSLPS